MADFPPRIDVSKFSEAERNELQRALNTEMQKGRIQASVHNLTDICFTKCVTAKISTSKLDQGEEACARNCVERFMDANTLILGRLQRGA